MPKGAVMAALQIRRDYPPSELRRRAARERDRRAAMRLLAIASALEGMTRAEAARLAGMERQALHDAVLRFNAEGPEGLHDRPRPGRPERLSEGQQAALTLVDATLIPSASIRHDEEARWAGHRRRKPVHGYKAHLATDQEAGLIRGVEITTANVHDAAELEAVLPPEPGDVYGDSAFAGARPERVIRARGGTPCIVHTSTWGG